GFSGRRPGDRWRELVAAALVGTGRRQPADSAGPRGGLFRGAPRGAPASPSEAEPERALPRGGGLPSLFPPARRRAPARPRLPRPRARAVRDRDAPALLGPGGKPPRPDPRGQPRRSAAGMARARGRVGSAGSAGDAARPARGRPSVAEGPSRAAIGDPARDRP